MRRHTDWQLGSRGRRKGGRFGGKQMSKLVCVHVYVLLHWVLHAPVLGKA